MKLPRVLPVLFLCVFICTNIASLATSRPLSILVAVAEFPVLSQTFIVNHVVGLIKEGHDVTIYADKKGRDSKEQTEIKDYQLRERAVFENLPEDLTRFDIILCELGQIGVRFARLKKQHQLPAKLITCFRGRDISAYALSHPGIYDELFTVGDLFLPVCRDFKERLIDLGADPEKIKIHYSSIDCGQFVPKKDAIKHDGVLRLVSVNRLVEKKGTHHILRALGKLYKHQQLRNFEYTIIGDGPMRPFLERLINRYGLQDKVILKGKCIREDIIKALHQADIFLLGSVIASNGDADGIANVLKEALAVGLCVAATPASGVKELVQDGCQGIYIIEDRRDWGEWFLKMAKKNEFGICNKQLTRRVIQEKCDVLVLQKELSQLCIDLVDQR